MNKTFGDVYAKHSIADIRRCLRIDNLENVIVNNYYTESAIWNTFLPNCPGWLIKKEI